LGDNNNSKDLTVIVKEFVSLADKEVMDMDTDMVHKADKVDGDK
jgi:hypothetical protein